MFVLLDDGRELKRTVFGEINHGNEFNEEAGQRKLD